MRLAPCAVVCFGLTFAITSSVASADEGVNPDGPLGSVVLTVLARPDISGELKDHDTKVADISGVTFLADLAFPVTPRVTILGGLARYSSNAEYIYTDDKLHQTGITLELGAKFVLGGH